MTWSIHTTFTLFPVNKKIELISELDDSSPKQLLIVKKVKKMKPYSNSKTGDQILIKNFFYKKEPYIVNSQWIDSLNKDFQKVRKMTLLQQ